MPDFYGSTATPFYPGGGAGGEKPKTMLDVFNQQNNPSWGIGSPVYGGNVVGTAGQGGMVNYPGYGVMDPTGKFFSPTTGGGKTIWNPTPVPKELFNPPGPPQGPTTLVPPYTPGPPPYVFDDIERQSSQNPGLTKGKPTSLDQYLGPTSIEDVWKGGHDLWTQIQNNPESIDPQLMADSNFINQLQNIYGQSAFTVTPELTKYFNSLGNLEGTTNSINPTSGGLGAPAGQQIPMQNPYSGYNQYQAPFQEWLSQMFNLSNPFMSQSSGIFG